MMPTVNDKYLHQRMISYAERLQRGGTEAERLERLPAVGFIERAAEAIQCQMRFDRPARVPMSVAIEHVVASCSDSGLRPEELTADVVMALASAGPTRSLMFPHSDVWFDLFYIVHCKVFQE